MANILSQETLIDIAAIGGGSVIAAQVVDKLAPKITKVAKLENNVYANNAVPILVGIFLPSVAGGGRIVNGLANGMIAYGAANIVSAAVDKFSGKSTPSAPSSSSTGGGSAQSADTNQATTGFMGNVMMQGVGENVMMGNTDDYNTYSSDSYDMTSADAGEMNF
jgi:hypothetical protein